MIGQLMRWSALVLLVYEASSQADVETLTITRMTWSYTLDSGVPETESNITELTVCTDDDNLAEEDDVIRLVVAEPGDENPTEEPFNGILANASCAIFSEGGELPLPSAEAAFYKLTVSSSSSPGDELKSGNVSFAYPVATSEIINCGGTTIGRLTLVGATSAPPNCFKGSGLTPELCYVDVDPGDENTVCVEGLDTNSNVVVCMANVQDSGATVPETFTVKYINYSDVSASLGVFYTVTDQSVLTELLSRVEGGDGSVTVHSCSDDLSCDLNPFSPSTDNYELCGVFTGGDAVTHVGTATFQDLKLTIDSTSPTLDFHFYNVEATSYNVYKDPNLDALGEATFTLDCTRISAGSYCNGFMLTDGDSPNTIAVSFTNATNVVATSVASSSQEPDEAVVSRAADEGEDAVDLQPSW